MWRVAAQELLDCSLALALGDDQVARRGERSSRAGHGELFEELRPGRVGYVKDVEAARKALEAAIALHGDYEDQARALLQQLPPGGQRRP